MDSEFTSDFNCPICREDKEKLQFTECGHKICENCKSQMFNKQQQNSVPCHICRRPLRRRDICEKSKEEIEFDNEIRIRNLLQIQFNFKC